jgi:hypothetical protein
MNDQIQTVAALYGYKLNPRESWALISKLYEVGSVTNTKVGTYIAFLEAFLRDNLLGVREAVNIRVLFISARPLYAETQVSNTEPFSIIFGVYVDNGVQLNRVYFFEDIRVFRRIIRESMGLRLDFSSTDPRLYYGLIVPNIPIVIDGLTSGPSN